MHIHQDQQMLTNNCTICLFKDSKIYKNHTSITTCNVESFA